MAKCGVHQALSEVSGVVVELLEVGNRDPRVMGMKRRWRRRVLDGSWRGEG